nr:putative F-box protein At4g22660 [Ziziphus jujuba var. spinosa]
MASNWSELQMELLDLIMKRLDAIVDIIRFKAVCSKWYRAAQLYMTSPLLMLPSDKKEEADDCRFFSVAENKIYKINNVFEGFHGAWCVGSSHGWLVILDKETKPHLLNPFSGAKVQLPFINTLLPYQELHLYGSSPYFVKLLVTRSLRSPVTIERLQPYKKVYQFTPPTKRWEDVIFVMDIILFYLYCCLLPCLFPPHSLSILSLVFKDYQGMEPELNIWMGNNVK